MTTTFIDRDTRARIRNLIDCDKYDVVLDWTMEALKEWLKCTAK
jgi:hypothetical protein